MTASMNWFGIVSSAIAMLLGARCVVVIEDNAAAWVWQYLTRALFVVAALDVVADCVYWYRGAPSAPLALFLVGALALFFFLVCVVMVGIAAGLGFRRRASLFGLWQLAAVIVWLGEAPDNWIAFIAALVLSCPLPFLEDPVQRMNATDPSRKTP